MDFVALADYGDKLAVGAVGFGDESVIHFANAKHFLGHLAEITLAQLHLLGKEFSAADFYCVGISHYSSSSMSSRLRCAFSMARGEPTCASIISWEWSLTFEAALPRR